MSAELMPTPEQASGLTQDQLRKRIWDLESAMLAADASVQIKLEAKHHFSPGVYMRELFIPKGVVLTGKIHKTEHHNILSQGDLTVMTENGMKRLTASTIIKSGPGMKRAGYANEDSVWITVHANPDEITNPDELESKLVAATEQEFFEYLESRKQIGGV